MLYDVDRDRLLSTVSELDDPAEVSRVVAEALISLGTPGDDPLDADLLRRLGDEQIRLGHGRRGVDLLDIAASWSPDHRNLSALREALQDRGADLRAVARLRALLPVAPEAARQLSDLYRDLGCPALALDHGPSRGRLRLWWLTGGPLWWVRGTARRRETADLDGRLAAAAEPGPLEPLLRAVLADAPRDRIAWQLSERADRLVAEDDEPAAARLLVEPVSAPDAHPLLLATAAGVASHLGDARLGLQLTARLDRRSPGLAPRRAEVLVNLDRLHDAWTELGDGRAEDFRDVRARILLAAGLPCLAVDARGEARFDRGEWRRRWWRIGGPLWFVRARGRRRDERHRADRLGPPQPAIEELAPAALGAALARAADVRAAVVAARPRRPADAVATLDAVYDPDRPTVPSLYELAWALYLDDQEELALRRIREARALEPAKAALLDAELTFLKYLWRFVEALEVLDRYARESGRPGESRASHGDLLDDLGFYALSRDALGPAEGLAGPARAMRRRQWWRTGGPLFWVRRRMRRSDEQALDAWRQRSADNARALGTVVGPDQATRLRAAPDRFTFLETRWRLRWNRVNVVARLVAGWAGAIAGGYVLARLAADLGPPWTIVVGVGGGAIGYAALSRINESTTASRILTRVLPAIAAVGVVGYLVTRIGDRWAVLAGAALVTAAGVAALRLVAAVGVRVAEGLQARRLQRADPRGFALVGLLEVLDDVGRPSLRNDLYWRRYRLRTLERVASRLETDLPAVFAADPDSAEHLRQRGRRAAAALRELKYQVVAAPPGAWRRVETALRTDIAALATGSLGRLLAVEPPARHVRHRSRRQIVVDGVRTLFFAGLPLAVVLVAQPWLRFNETILNWARLLTIGWALLYVLLTVDPTFRDKLRTGFALINLGRGTGDLSQLDPVAEKRTGPAK